MQAEPEIYAIRLGYGLSPLTTPPETLDDYLQSVKRAEQSDGVAWVDRLRKLDVEYGEINRRLREGDKSAEEARVNIRRKLRDMSLGLVQSRLARAVGDTAGFGERLVQFWADHFSIQAGNPIHTVMTTAHTEEAIRPHLAGKFADMLFFAETHPAMFLYLEQDRSFGPNSIFARQRKGRIRVGLNENLAREMIELHSLGVSANYSQRDVTQLAELLTGLRYTRATQDIFDPKGAEPGAETILGKNYGGEHAAKLDDIRAAIHDLAVHEATAAHIARKLAVHFVSDNPPKPLVDRLAAVFRDSGGDLSAVNRALVESPELTQHFREKVRQPFDFIASGLRALGITERNVMSLKPNIMNGVLYVPLQQMGQRWAKPRGPDGWPEAAENWATPPGLAARMNWAFNAPRRVRRVMPDPREFLETALGGTASEALKWAVPKAESNREGVAVVLASSDFNRR